MASRGYYNATIREALQPHIRRPELGARIVGLVNDINSYGPPPAPIASEVNALCPPDLSQCIQVLSDPAHRLASLERQIDALKQDQVTRFWRDAL